MEPRQKPKVKLVGEDGNAFAIMGRVSKALRDAGYPEEEVQKYLTEAKSGDYNHLLQVTLDWVDPVEDPFRKPEAKVSGGSITELPAGTYYIGDPCYVIKDSDKWRKVCDEMGHRQEVVVELDGQKMFLAYTRYGDGEYADGEMNRYPVDSGTIGAVPLELVVGGQDEAEMTGSVRLFLNGLTIRYEDGDFQFGHVHICTGDQEDPEEGYADDYDEEDEEDDEEDR